MDVARWDIGRWDRCNWDIISVGEWSIVLKRLKNISIVYPPIPVDGVIDCIVDSVGDEARVDVYTDHWQQLKRQKNIPTPYPRILVDGDVDCIVDSVGDDARLDVYSDIWQDMKRTLKKV